MDAPVKLCPQCGEEYLATAERCIDCGVPLVHEGQAPGGATPPPDEPEGLPEVDPANLVLLREAEIAWARRLAEALEAEGVPCRVAALEAVKGGARGSWSGRWGVFVLREDEVRALEVDAARLREEIPALEGAPVGEDTGGCPACGSDVSADAAECPECGLAFGA